MIMASGQEIYAWKSVSKFGVGIEHLKAFGPYF